jgi:hypothetical protein
MRHYTASLHNLLYGAGNLGKIQVTVFRISWCGGFGTGWTIWDSIPGKGTSSFSSSEYILAVGLTQLRGPPEILSLGIKRTGGGGGGVKLTNHLHLMSNLRINVAVCLHAAHKDNFNLYLSNTSSAKSGRQITAPLLTYHVCLYRPMFAPCAVVQCTRSRPSNTDTHVVSW